MPPGVPVLIIDAGEGSNLIDEAFAIAIETNAVHFMKRMLRLEWTPDNSVLSKSISSDRKEMFKDLVASKYPITTQHIDEVIKGDKLDMLDILISEKCEMTPHNVLTAINHGDIRSAYRLIKAGCKISPECVKCAIKHRHPQEFISKLTHMLATVDVKMPEIASNIISTKAINDPLMLELRSSPKPIENAVAARNLAKLRQLIDAKYVISNEALLSSIQLNSRDDAYALMLIRAGCEISSAVLRRAIYCDQMRVVDALLDRKCRITSDCVREARIGGHEKLVVHLKDIGRDDLAAEREAFRCRCGPCHCCTWRGSLMHETPHDDE